VKKVLEVISLLFSLVLIGSFIAVALQHEKYWAAGGLLVVFLLLAKVHDIDTIKVNLKNKSIEVEDKHVTKK